MFQKRIRWIILTVLIVQLFELSLGHDPETSNEESEDPDSSDLLSDLQGDSTDIDCLCRKLQLLCRVGFACKEYRRKCKCTQPTVPTSTTESTTPDDPYSRALAKCLPCCEICNNNTEVWINGEVLTCDQCTNACWSIGRGICPTPPTTPWSTTLGGPVPDDDYLCFVCCDICKYGYGEVNSRPYNCTTCTPSCGRVGKEVCDPSYYVTDGSTDYTDYTDHSTSTDTYAPTTTYSLFNDWLTDTTYSTDD